jgi:RNA polymerase-binding transcription factor DksA
MTKPDFTLLRKRLLALRARLQGDMTQMEDNALNIEAAIERIEDGSYGRCEKCGEKIPKTRLEAIPYAAECVRCASQQEHGSAEAGVSPQ